jgi:hypothetical protein
VLGTWCADTPLGIDGVWRCKSRAASSSPAIAPRRCRFSESILGRQVANETLIVGETAA